MVSRFEAPLGRERSGTEVTTGGLTLVQRLVALLASFGLAASLAVIPGSAIAASAPLPSRGTAVPQALSPGCVPGDPCRGAVGTWYNPATGLCVGIQNQGTNVGQRAVGTICKSDHTDQIWFADDSPTGGKGGWVTEHTWMCLDTATSSTAGNPNRFAAVVQWICNATASQRWQPIGVQFVGDPTQYWELQNQFGGWCLSLTSFDSGHSLDTDSCALGPDFLNLFIFIPR